MMFDVFDLAFAQAGAFSNQWTYPQAWTNWVAVEFARSPFLRDEYKKIRGWYGPDMSNLVNHIEDLTNYVKDYHTNSTPVAITPKP